MTDEPLRPQGPSAQARGGLPQDDPTLETGDGPADDEPTLETPDQAVAEETTEETATPKVRGWGARLEQMTQAKQERRRRTITRFWLATIPVLLIVMVVAVLLAVYGGQDGTESVMSTTTIPEAQPAAGSALLLVKDDGVLSWAVVLQPWDAGGVVLAVPGITLVESGGVFGTLADFYESEGGSGVKAGLAAALEVPLGPVAIADRQAISQAAGVAETGATPDDPLDAEQAGGERLAQAVRDLVAQHEPDGGTDKWNGLLSGGETADFLKAIGIDAKAMAQDVWTTGVLTGQKVEGEGFAYLEPNVQAARALLVVVTQPTVISVEVKDGAGLEGAPRRAGDLLEAGGLVLAPMGYAEGYPNIEKTQIMVPPGLEETALQIRTLLGVGDVVQDETLAGGQIVVILGKDFGTAATTTPPGSE